MPSFRYFLVHKPYLVLSQFSTEPGKQTLADFFNVPKNVYPVGRLDHDSEGLLILTNDRALNQRLLHPRFAHPRVYWAQVEGTVTDEALSMLSNGVQISLEGTPYRTRPCVAERMYPAPSVQERTPPVRFRKTVPDDWLRLALTEGKNRQVRKMTAAVGLPTLRLIRYAIGKLTLEGLQPGNIKEISSKTFQAGLFG